LSTATTTKVLRYALVICSVSGQQPTFRNSSFLTVTPDSTAIEFAFGAEGGEVSQQPYGERRFARIASAAHSTLEPMLEFQIDIDTHGWSVGYDMTLSLPPPIYTQKGRKYFHPNATS